MLSRSNSTDLADAAIELRKHPPLRNNKARAEEVTSETDLLSLDVQMRMVAELEDVYWNGQFSKEAYYVAGRGYDQYRPAYELGWNAALAHPDVEYTEVAAQLEAQWQAQKFTSLLPWREVEDAVKSAWVHASKQMQSMQVEHQAFPVGAYGREITQYIQALYRACVLLADDIRRMSRVSMNDFSQQVLGRHQRILRKFASQLKGLLAVDTPSTHLLGPLQQLVRLHWKRLKSRLSEWDVAQVFEVCELRERSLLALYQSTLRKPLPAHVEQLLDQQAKLLQNNMEKLSWVRQNWTL